VSFGLLVCATRVSEVASRLSLALLGLVGQGS